MDTRRPAPPTVFRAAAPADAPGLGALFAALHAAGDDRFFHPHPFTQPEADRIAGYTGADYYAVAADGTTLLGYGMLRGWAEGYAVPSLGIALAPQSRGTGLAGAFMGHLHEVAIGRKAPRIRLKVYPDNLSAKRLYEKLGYVFGSEEKGQLVGMLELGRSADA